MNPATFVHAHRVDDPQPIDLEDWSGGLLQAISGYHALVVFRLDGTIIEVNRGFCALMGFARSALVGHTHRMFMPPGRAEGPSYDEHWGRLAAMKQPVTGRVLWAAAGGRDVWIQGRHVAVRDAKGSMRLVAKVVTEVSDHARQHFDLDAERSARKTGRAPSVPSDPSGPSAPSDPPDPPTAPGDRASVRPLSAGRSGSACGTWCYERSLVAWPRW